ncbi:MAG TPA: tetratricopeptide repeat protein [Gammaproteobacteria bacterium]|nr:tetratricopeptide repeat protein [Gammaproteobacteria bacterium]
MDSKKLPPAFAVLAGFLGLFLLYAVSPALAQTPRKSAPYVGYALSGRPCSSFKGEVQGYGPYDYRNYSSSDHKLKIVEEYHFTRQVAALKGGKNSKTPIGDLNYTLMAFPNHHRALFAMIRLYTSPVGEKWKSYPQFSSRPPPECFLQRAIHFRPKDAHLYLLYGIYLHRLGKTEKAVQKYHHALKIDPQLSEAWYNLGLALLKEKKFEKARQAAQKAYKDGFPLPGLRKRLAQAGYHIH